MKQSLSQYDDIWMVSSLEATPIIWRRSLSKTSRQTTTTKPQNKKHNLHCSIVDFRRFSVVSYFQYGELRRTDFGLTFLPVIYRRVPTTTRLTPVTSDCVFKRLLCVPRVHVLCASSLWRSTRSCVGGSTQPGGVHTCTFHNHTCTGVNSLTNLLSGNSLKFLAQGFPLLPFTRSNQSRRYPRCHKTSLALVVSEFSRRLVSILSSIPCQL